MSPIAAAAVVCALAVAACSLARRACTDRQEAILYLLLVAMTVLLAGMVPSAEVP
jgi:hypothetical protein